MARIGKSPPAAATPAAAPAFSPPEAWAPPPGGLDASREVLSSALASAQNLVAWCAQWQRSQAQAWAAWEQTLDETLREVRRADDMTSLMAVPASLVNRQLSLAAEQFGACCSQWLEGEFQLADRMRGEATTLAHSLAGAANAPESGDGAEADASPLGQLARLQDEWLANTQRWIEAAKAGAVH